MVFICSIISSEEWHLPKCRQIDAWHVNVFEHEFIGHDKREIPSWWILKKLKWIFPEEKFFTCNDVEDFSYKEIFYYNSDIDKGIVFDEFDYFDVDQVEIMNEIFDDIYHIGKLQNRFYL